MKYFIITIDTEGDNLWEYTQGETITTKNARYIPRFQEFCERYNFKPVYLVNYEMAHDNFFVDFAKKTLSRDKCEIGIHLHAWNNPPHYELQKGDKDCGLPYLIEYPKNIMRGKFNVLYNLLKEKFDTDIITHRSGRWAMNQDYFDLLIEHGIKIDCSVTPHRSWNGARGLSVDSKGSNYTDSSEEPFIVKHSSTDQTITEIPLTIRRLRRFYLDKTIFFNPLSFAYSVKNAITAKPVWLRPNGKNLSTMLALIDYIKKSESSYLMFMLHSSELMPGGSPTFKNTKSIENLYNHLELLFSIISKDFRGITLNDYYFNYIKSA
jgi:hypothetical protein